MELKALKRVFKTALTFISILAVDIIIYGEIFPLVGLLSGSYITTYFDLPPVAGVFIVAGCTTLLFFMSLGLRLEVHFWRKLYRLEAFYKYVLYVRDTVNAVCLAVFVAELVSLSFSSTVQYDGRTKDDSNVHSHPIQGFLYILCQRFDLYGLRHFFGCCQESSETTPDIEHESDIFHATAFIVTSIAKMLYYNTLFTYLNAVKMFHEMQPTVQRIQNRGGRGQNGRGNRRNRPRGQTQNGAAAEIDDAPGTGAPVDNGSGITSSRNGPMAPRQATTT